MRPVFRLSTRKLIPALTWLGFTGWSLLLVVSLSWMLQHDEQRLMEMAYAEARVSLNRDMIFRRWASDHGGVYVPATEKQRPIPWLDHLPERDLTTTDGRRLTLLNPSSMLKQVMDRNTEILGVRSRITALRPLNPENAPDPWEREQLEIFTKGERREVSAIAEIDGKPYLRYMRAMLMEPGCEKCHVEMGYKTGDLRGATGVILPLAPYLFQIEDGRRNLLITYGVLWPLGLAGILLMSALARKRERELNEIESIVQTTDDAIISKSLDGTIKSWNAGAERLFGYRAEETVGRPVAMLFPADKRVEEKAILARLSQGETLEHYETIGMRKDGSCVEISVTISPIRDESGHVVGASRIARDISERRKIEREQANQKIHLEELVTKRTAELSEALTAAKLADKTKDAFLANISHELRTPLNAMIGMANLARNTRLDPQQQDYLDKIIVSGRHLNRIVNDLLDLSKIAAGRLEFENIGFRLSGVVSRCIELLMHRAREKGLALVESVDPTVPDVLIGDPSRIEQILLNLIGNAIKFTPSGQVSLNVGVREDDGRRVCLHFDVVDTGIGVPSDYLEQIFDPFSQADASVSRVYGGSGLGLPISRQLARMMGGDIALRSDEGRGSTFSVTVWLDKGSSADLSPPPVLADEALPAAYENARVLVADDQPINREIVAALLGSVGVSPVMAGDGTEALDLLRQAGAGAFDLVLMDVQMPAMDGLAATREIRSWDGFADLPVIGMTAHTMEHEKRACIDSGMNDHLGKPFDNVRFFRVLAHWLPRDKRVVGDMQKAGAQAFAPDAGSGDRLATLEGLDVRGAIVRFNGKEDRYRHWLMDFVETVDQALSLIQEAIDVGDIDAATKVVHSFKGRVGMLGMTALQAEVSDLERLLRSGEDVEGMLGRVAQSAAGMRCRLQQALSRNGSGDMPGIEHVVWCDAFSVGVAEIDEQHKRLVGMINRLADCLQADTDCQFDEILSEMFDYSQVHFKSEEVYMARIGYPMLQEHEREHGAFIERISNLSIAAADGARDMAGTYRFLRGWLLGHILKSDMQYRHFVERTIT